MLTNRVWEKLSSVSNSVDRAAFEHRDSAGRVVDAADNYDDRAADLVHEARERAQDADVHVGGMGPEACRWLYAAVAASDADTVVETGVANGVSTTALLAAADVADAEVVSIDLPFTYDSTVEQHRRETYQEFGGAGVPADASAGWAIPDTLRDRWTLHEGRSQRVLPDVLADLGEVDVFVHDSEHSRLCVSFELEAGWPRLREDGVVICDDVSWAGAWDEFVDRRVPETYHGRLAPDVGFAVKPE
jgi:predicted O-methyltransferase YrrM